jgi:hypothetical protein
MGACLVEREHLLLEAKEGDPLFSDVNGDGASVGDIVERGNSVAQRSSQFSVLGSQCAGAGIHGVAQCRLSPTGN